VDVSQPNDGRQLEKKKKKKTGSAEWLQLKEKRGQNTKKRGGALWLHGFLKRTGKKRQLSHIGKKTHKNNAR